MSYVAAMANGCKRHFRCFEEASRTQPNRARRTEVAAQRRQACVPEAQASAGFLAADAGTSDEEITKSVGVSGSTVYRTKRRFVEGNLERALSEEPRPGGGTQTHGQGRSLTGGDRLRQSAKGPCPLDAQAAGGCDGQAYRTQEPVARDGSAAPGRKWPQALAQRHVCIPQVDGEYVAHMEDGLDLYAEASDSRRKVVCFRKPGATHRRGASVVRLLRFLASEFAVLNKFAAERLTTSVVVTVFTCTCCHRAGNPPTTAIGISLPEAERSIASTSNARGACDREVLDAKHNQRMKRAYFRSASASCSNCRIRARSAPKVSSAASLNSGSS